LGRRFSIKRICGKISTVLFNHNPDIRPMNAHLSLAEQRQLIRPLLAATAPEDALTAYYALWHDPRRTTLTLHRSPNGHVDGFVAICQTGQDLFVPLVTLRAPSEATDKLLRQALTPGRPYRLIITPTQREAIEAAMLLEQAQINIVYKPGEIIPPNQVNVLVEPGQGPFRFEIRDQDHPIAVAGINWQTDQLAEMYVYVEPDFQMQGWGRAVAQATVNALLEARLLPLYITAEGNKAARQLADSLGFVDSGAREFEAVGRLRE